MLRCELNGRLGSFELDATFTSGPGITVLFGRSGAGKTSIVNMIAGLSKPSRGRVELDGRVLLDTERNINLPAHKRHIGYVFQEHRLFPHLNVRQNLVYSHWFRRASNDKSSVTQITSLLGLGHLLDRSTSALSGGERQRVALGRALLSRPSLLLMDEPLASLDAHHKAEILPYIERLRDEAGIPIVYVSHSLEEVSRLATTLVLLSNGRVVASGSPGELLSRLDLRPHTGRFEAGSLITTRVARHLAEFELTELSFEGGMLRLPRIDQPLGSPVRIHIRARDVALALKPPENISIQNVLEASIADMSNEQGAFTEVQLNLGPHQLLTRITRKSALDLKLHPGKRVYALVKSIALDRRGLDSGTRH